MIFKGVFIIRRLQSDNKLSAGGESFQFKQIMRSLKDWKTWVASKCISYGGSLAVLLNRFSGYVYGFVSIFIHSVAISNFANTSDGPLYAFSLFTPSIINQLG